MCRTRAWVPNMGRPRKGITFWDRVAAGLDIHSPGGCHIWNGHKNEDVYACIHRDGRVVRLHREIWARENGAIPPGLQVLHRCDRPACLNIAHLFIGTHLDNMVDCRLKGRKARLKGSRNGCAKLDEERVGIIKRELQAGVSCASLGRRFGVSDVAIGFIKHGTKWSHVEAGFG